MCQMFTAPAAITTHSRWSSAIRNRVLGNKWGFWKLWPSFRDCGSLTSTHSLWQWRKWSSDTQFSCITIWVETFILPGGFLPQNQTQVNYRLNTRNALFLLPLSFVLFETNILVFPDTQIYKLQVLYMYLHVHINTLFILQAGFLGFCHKLLLCKTLLSKLYSSLKTLVFCGFSTTFSSHLFLQYRSLSERL